MVQNLNILPDAKDRAEQLSTVIPAYQRLKYRPLSAFVKQEVRIPNFHAIESVLLREMSAALSAQFTLQSERNWMAALMAKYGALDLTFIASAPVLDAADAVSWGVLRTLGLSDNGGNLGEEFEWVERNLRDDQCFLRLFLSYCLPSDAMWLRDEQAKIEMAKGVPPREASSAALDYLTANIHERFPLTFTIDDACLTNSPSIWVNAHFYL